jgi:3'(2'), 5'-bisphosphate nucleotidase
MSKLAGVDVKEIVRLAKQAGEAILEIYDKDFAVEIKEDQSPLTAADRASNQVIVDGLEQLYPQIPIISEENRQIAYEDREHWPFCWVVDPLDGTKEFIKKNGEFTVNIALVHNGAPVLGVVYVPVQGITYYAAAGQGAFMEDADGNIKQLERDYIPYREKQTVKVVASRSHLTPETEQFIADLEKAGKEVQLVSVGSSIKLCLVASGQADVYPRFGPTMEWDTAAANAVAIFAGRKVINFQTGLPLDYNKPNLLNPWFIVE